MKEEKVVYEIDGSSYDVFLVSEDGASRRPAVMVCHAWGGRDAFAEDKARRLASMGYVGAAIDLYGIGKRGTDMATSHELMSSLTDNPAELRRRLRTAFEQVRAVDAVDDDRVGVVGYCFGGLCAILMARMGLPLRAAVSFHGLLKIGENLDDKPVAPILVLHGQDDPLVPPADVGAFAEEMKRIDADWQLHSYARVMHAFTNPNANNPDFGTVYDEGADRKSWQAMSLFLEENLS